MHLLSWVTFDISFENASQFDIFFKNCTAACICYHHDNYKSSYIILLSHDKYIENKKKGLFLQYLNDKNY